MSPRPATLTLSPGAGRTGGGAHAHRAPVSFSKRRGKYNARQTWVDGIKFDSAREARRYSELRLLIKAGEISDLVLQPEFRFMIAGKPLKMRNGQTAKYTADFGYMQNNQMVIEDCKGVIVRDFPLRRALFETLYAPLKIKVVK